MINVCPSFGILLLDIFWTHYNVTGLNHRVLYEFETWSHVVWEAHTLWVFKKMCWADSNKIHCYGC
jgi:hypothetical protein